MQRGRGWGLALSAAWLFESPGRNAVTGRKAVLWWSCFRPDQFVTTADPHSHVETHGDSRRGDALRLVHRGCDAAQPGQVEALKAVRPV